MCPRLKFLRDLVKLIKLVLGTQHALKGQNLQTACRVRNNMRPPAIFRAFQQDDRPTSYLQGHDGRTIQRLYLVCDRSIIESRGCGQRMLYDYASKSCMRVRAHDCDRLAAAYRSRAMHMLSRLGHMLSG